MTLYKEWCDTTKEKEGRKHYWSFVEKAEGRDDIRDGLTETMRSHYDRLERIADDVARLGYLDAAKILMVIDPQIHDIMVAVRARRSEIFLQCCGREISRHRKQHVINAPWA